MRELKGYKKIFIKAGETAKIEFNVGLEELSFFNSNLERVVEPGEFTVYVGDDCMASDNIKLVIER